ncbi:MAG TPA: hypothetical protein VHY09_11555 [Candidatus Methylacidiphilales bacterium]|jgi:hypothetical protein|nr:hypothetical protein [Candidatus Methylacidiphilales bacterium]
MPRTPTGDANAERAVTLFKQEIAKHSYSHADAWKAVIKLLVTCEIWAGRAWIPQHGQPVFRESNDYKLLKDGKPSKALHEAELIGNYLAAQLRVPQTALCSNLGSFIKSLNIQPNNPRGHAFRSISAEFLSSFGDPSLTVAEEISPHDLFPGVPFNLRSAEPRVDLTVHRGNNLVALCSVRWSYRHDRVDMLEEAAAYMAPARRINGQCRFFGITAEMNPARLKKVVSQTTPISTHAAMTRLVHVHPPLATTVIGHNGPLGHLMSLEQWAADSFNWK